MFIDDHTHVSVLPREATGAVPAAFLRPEQLIEMYDETGIDQGIFVQSNLAGPTNIWFDEKGDLLVIDWSGGAVKRFNSAGVFQLDRPSWPT